MLEHRNATSVWKVHGRRKLDYCPECHGHDTLHFVSFEPEYSKTLSAQVYQCRRCDAWLDVLGPQSHYSTLKFQRLLDSMRNQSAAV